MENASKAILIAGGMLITMLVVSLIIYARSNYTVYFNSQQEFKDIQDVTTFNKQFTNYERENVTGNEIISLINKIIDYNNRESDKTDNNYQANPIDFYMLLGNESMREKFVFEDSPILFTNSEYYIDNTNNTAYTQINITNKKSYNNLNYNIRFAEDIKNAISEVGSEEDISKISKDIKGVFYTYTDSANDSEKLSVIRKYNSYISKTDKELSENISEINDSFTQLLNVKKDAVKKYYEYMQFKKGIFKCTGIEYNKNTGRISKINFEFTGKIQ